MQNTLKVLIPRLAWAYLHFVGWTSRVLWLDVQEKERVEKEQGNFIYAFWHGRQVFITWAYRNTGNTALVSRSKDGEYIARVVTLFGETVVRGSSSRGGAQSVMELKSALDGGKIVGLTPDGPRGPKQTVSGGILFLAQKTGKPILPLTYSSKRKLVFHGWDDYWVPLPFSRIALALGRPIRVLPGDDLEKKSEELARELNRITELADDFVLGKRMASNPTVTPYGTAP